MTGGGERLEEPTEPHLPVVVPLPARPLRKGMLLGPWRVGEVLGRGAGAIVYRARHRDADQEVALKVVPREEIHFFARLPAELEALRRVQHPHVVRLFEGGEERGWAWIAMELVEGAQIDRWVQALPAEERARQVLELGSQLAQGLAAVHEAGFVHRDLKPANILVDRGGQVRLLDFGLARPIDGADPDEKVVGTLRYMAPEQMAGVELDLRADLFSLGVLLYELITGEPPHRAADPASLVLQQCTEPAPPISARAPELPEAAALLIDRLLCSAAVDRPRSALLVARQLRRALGAPWGATQVRPMVLNPRLVGRRELVRQLRVRALKGSGKTLVVHGPAGSGISRLLSEVRGEVLVRGGRHTLVAGGPQLLLRIIDGLAGALAPAELREHLLAEDRALLLSAWPHLARHEEQAPRIEAIEPRALQAAAVRVLRRARGRGPYLLAIDDADRANPTELRALADTASLLLLGTHRPELLPASLERIPLLPLSPSQLAEMARSMIDEAGPALAWENADRIAGRPGALVALAHGWGARQAPRTLTEGPTFAGDLDWAGALSEAELALVREGPAAAAAWLERPSSPAPLRGRLRHRLELLRSRIEFQRGDPERALDAATRAMVATDDPPARSQARLDATRVAFRRGLASACATEATLGRREAADLGNGELVARWAVLEARALARSGQLREARRRLPLNAGMEISPQAALGLAWTRAHLEVAACSWAEARNALDHAGALAQTAGRPRALAGLHHLAGLMQLRQGEISRAAHQLERAVQKTDRLGDGEMLSATLADLAQAWWWGAHADAAQASANRAWLEALRVQTPEVMLTAMEARLITCRGGGEALAESDAAELLRTVDPRLLDQSSVAVLLLELGRLRIEMGSGSAGREDLSRAWSYQCADPYLDTRVRLGLLEAGMAPDRTLEALMARCTRRGLGHLLRRTAAADPNLSLERRSRLVAEASAVGDLDAVAALNGS